MRETNIFGVSVTGGTWRERIRVYQAALRLQRWFNRATPEQQERAMAVLKQGGAREVRRDR
jgi:hypothetical protein